MRIHANLVRVALVAHTHGQQGINGYKAAAATGMSASQARNMLKQLVELELLDFDGTKYTVNFGRDIALQMSQWLNNDYCLGNNVMELEENDGTDTDTNRNERNVDRHLCEEQENPKGPTNLAP